MKILAILAHILFHDGKSTATIRDDDGTMVAYCVKCSDCGKVLDTYFSPKAKQEDIEWVKK